MASGGSSGAGMQTIEVDRHCRHAFESLFERGYRGPIADPADPGQPKPHSVVTFNIPRKCVPNNADTLHDVFAGIALHDSKLSAYTKLLGMLSMGATQPIQGFRDLAQPGKDKRGVVPNAGSGLVFEHNGRRYNRTIQCIEDLVTPSNAVIGHRIWVFVLDPAINVGNTFKQVADSNNTIYHTPDKSGHVGVLEGNAYVHHSQVNSESEIYDLFSLFISDGVSSLTAQQQKQRSTFRVLQGMLSDMSHNQALNAQPLTNKDSDVHPTAVLSPMAAFCFHTHRVCEQQRDINNYFSVPTEDEHDGIDDADPAGPGQNNGDEDLAALVGEVSEEVDLADEELEAMQMMAGSNSLDGGEGDDETDSDLLPRSARHFMQFPCPDLVQKIPIHLFGRKLLNVPMRIAYASRNAADDSVDVDGLEMDVIVKELHIAEPVSEEMPVRERGRILRSLHEQHVAANFDPSSEEYFTIDGDSFNVHSVADCNALLRRIYRAYLVNYDTEKIQRVKRDINRTLMTASRIIFHNEAVFDFEDSTRAPSGLPVPLPELCSEEGVRQAEIEKFAETDDFLMLRLENHATYNDIITEYVVGSEEFDERMASFRSEAAEKFWSVFLDSQNIPHAVSTASAFFKKLEINEQWPEHLLLARDLSAFGNTMLLFLSRYNDIFRGATTHTIFLLLYTVSINTAMYHFGLRPNVLLTGDGGTGKSFPMLAVEALVPPGTFKAYTHITAKAFSTGQAKKGKGTKFNDQTLCMHEAARNFIGVDERGFDNSGDPVFKDRLTRQRSGTLAFGTDESGARITIEEEAMSMFNHIFATNDAVPEETKALMQRFINVPVHYTKRVGFNKGDQSHVSPGEVNQRLNAKHKTAAQVFGFYCLVVEKMIESWVIPEPSVDCANGFMREVLRIYREDTGIDTSDSRKRTMVTHLMRTGAVMNAVSVSLCSPLSWNISWKTCPDGQRRRQSFHPQMVIDHVMPRLYVTDEIAIFYMTMCSFMWEPRNQWDILNTFISTMNGSPQKPGSVLDRKKTTFRYKKNPRYRPYRGRSGGNSASFSVQGINSQPAQEPREEPEFLVDTGYVSIATSAANLAYNKISAAATGSRPSVTEVRRVIESLKTTWRVLHKSRIVQSSVYEDERPQATGDSVPDPDNDLAMEEDDDDEYQSELGASGEAVHGGFSGIADDTAGGHQTQEEIYKHESFRWECDTDTIKERSAPVVIVEPDPTSRSNRIVISVMIEAVMDDTFNGGIKRAIQKLMQKNNVPRGGRNILTASDYQRKEGNEVVETMPQYKEVLHIKRTEEPMILRHMPIGTQDSNAFINSTILHNPADINAAQMILQNSLGTRLDEPPNAHYARLHWRACDLPAGEGWYSVMPETDTEEILRIQDALLADQRECINYIPNYPHDSAKAEVRRREVDRLMNRNPNHDRLKEFIVSSTEFHQNSSLAASINALNYCYFDYNTGKVIFDEGVSEEDRQKANALVQRSKSFSSSYSDIRVRKQVNGASRPQVPQRSVAPRIVRNSRGMARISQSFSNCIATLGEELDNELDEATSSGSKGIPLPRPDLKRKRKQPPQQRKKQRTGNKVGWGVAPSSNVVI